MFILKELTTHITDNVRSAFPILLLFFGMHSHLFAEKGIIYDPDKGIIFSNDTHPSSANTIKTKEKKVTHPLIFKSSKTTKTTTKKEDLHFNRKKDPPEIYFKSGLEYFKNNDFPNALKNFTYADSLSGRPLYKLWKAKTLRKMNQYSKMLKLFYQITTDFGNSDVADDALLEMAIYYKSFNDYEKSLQTLTRLIEQYPFGVCCATGEELSSIARNQRRLIRQEMINNLAILGYQKEDLPTSYRQFQKDNELKITGTGTIETVSLIKNLNERLFKKQEKESEKSRQSQKYQWLMLLSVFLLLITLSSLMVLRIKINARKKHLLDLKHTLIELETGKL